MQPFSVRDAGWNRRPGHTVAAGIATPGMGAAMKERIDYKTASPEAYKAMLGIETYVGSCGIEHSLLELVKTRVSQINGCAHCLDMHTKDARAAEETEQRLYLLNVPRTWGWPDESASWTWPGAEGRPLSIRVYTTGDQIETRLNGRTLATRSVAAEDLKRVEFTAVYVPGVLEAVAFRNGVEIARRTLATAGAPAAIRLTAECTTNLADRSHVAFVNLEIVDQQGRVIPDVARAVQLTVSGPAELVAFGSANPVAVGSLQSPVAQTWDGRALAILRSRGQRGDVSIEARSNGLQAGSAHLRFA